MPGAVTNAAGIYDAHVFRYGSWVNFDGSEQIKSHSDFRSDGPYYGTQFYIWDAKCTA